jgi:outer membrane protein assembly factor BamB
MFASVHTTTCLPRTFMIARPTLSTRVPGFFGRPVQPWLTAAAMSLAAVCALGDDWPQWRGPHRDGISQEKGWSHAWPADGPKQVWKADIGLGYGTVSVSRGRLYVMGNTADTDTVYCLHAHTGAVVWKHSYPATAKDPNGYPGPRCTPTVDGATVFTVGRHGQLFALDAATGEVRWSKDYKKDFGAEVPTWGYSTSPLVEGNLVIVETSGQGASVVAFDKATGKVAWQNGNDPAAYSSPVAFDSKGERCLAVLSAPGLVFRSAKDGRELGRFPWKTSYDVNAATPIIAGDKVFISSGYNKGCALIQVGASAPTAVWETKKMRNHANSCVLWQGHLYGFDESELKCIELATGEVKWGEKKYGKGSLMLADGKLILYSNRAKLGVAQASPEGYRELALAQVIQIKQYPPGANPDTWAAPVLAQGKIYCRSLDDLVCLDAKGQ